MIPLIMEKYMKKKKKKKIRIFNTMGFFDGNKLKKN